jgi:hypothetical protein
MATSCEPIDPYTATGTFGVSYNGGYKPDTSLDWIPPDSNTLDGLETDDFLPPPILPPPNMLMNTREGRKIDPRVGTITKREMEFDDFTEQTQLIIEVGDAPGGFGIKESEEFQMKILGLLAIILFIILAVTKFS